MLALPSILGACLWLVSFPDPSPNLKGRGLGTRPGADPEFYERTGLLLASAAKLAHAHYRQVSRARSARSWPVGMYVRSVLA